MSEKKLRTPSDTSVPRIGRPPAEVNEQVVEAMALCGANNTEIAEFCGCSVDTITRRFADTLSKGRAQVRIKLRRAQMKLALGGNATMLIWLGKNTLGQSDQTDADIPNAIAVAQAIRESLRAIDEAA